MATFTEMMNKSGAGLQDAFSNPWTQLGLQMLQQGGYQPNNPGFGQRFGAAGMGFMEQQQQAAQMQQQQLLRQVQMAEAARQMQKQEEEAKTRGMVKERVKQDQSILANNPLARAVLESTGDYTGIKDLAEFGPKTPGAPKMPWQYQQFDPSGNATQYIYDPASGGYQAGATYRPPQQQNVDIRGAGLGLQQQRYETEQQFKERQAAERSQQWGAEQALREKQAGTAAVKAETAAEKEQRAAMATELKNKVARTDLQAGYRGATAQMDKVLNLVRTLKGHKGLDRSFGVYGAMPTVPGSDAADAQAKLEEMKANLGLSELVRLGQAGIRLTPVSNTDLAQAQSAGANLDRRQSAEQARQQLDMIEKTLLKAKEEASTTFGQMDSLYDVQTPSRQPPQAPGAQQGAPQGQAAPKTKAEYDALPSGTIYIDPATGRPARKR